VKNHVPTKQIFPVRTAFLLSVSSTSKRHREGENRLPYVILGVKKGESVHRANRHPSAVIAAVGD
jgi:hypothetical protein